MWMQLKPLIWAANENMVLAQTQPIGYNLDFAWKASESLFLIDKLRHTIANTQRNSSQEQ